MEFFIKKAHCDHGNIPVWMVIAIANNGVMYKQATRGSYIEARNCLKKLRLGMLSISKFSRIVAKSNDTIGFGCDEWKGQLKCK